MPSLDIKSTARGAANQAKSKAGGIDGPLKQALDRFLNAPTMGAWDQYLLQLQATAPWINYDTSDLDDRITGNVLKGGGRKRKLHPPHTALNYQGVSEMGGGLSLLMGQKALENYSLNTRLSGLMGMGHTPILSNAQSFINRISSPTSQRYTTMPIAPREAPVQGLIGGPMVSQGRATGSDVAPILRDQDVVLHSLASIARKHYELDRSQLLRAGGGAVAMEGMYVPFREVPRTLGLGGGGPRLISGPGPAWGWPSTTPSWGGWGRGGMAGGGWGMAGGRATAGATAGGGGGWGGWGGWGGGIGVAAGAGAAAGAAIGRGYGGGAGGAPPAGPGLPPPGVGGGAPPGGGPPPPGPPPGPGLAPGGGGGGGWNIPWGGIGKFARGAAAAYLGFGPAMEFIQNRGRPDFEYTENMYAIARARGESSKTAESLKDTLYPSVFGAPTLKDWQVKYGVGPLTSSKLVRQFPVLPGPEGSLSDLESMAKGLAKAPYLPGFSALDPNAVREHLGFLAAAIPINRYQSPGIAASYLAPHLEDIAGGMSQSAMLAASRAVLEMKIGFGGIGVGVEPEDILSRSIAIGNTGTPAARLGIAQQNIASLQNQAVENFGSSPLQSFSGMKVLGDLRANGVASFLGKNYADLKGNKVSGRIIQDMEIALQNNNMAAAMGLLPAFLSVSGRQDALTQASGALADQMFPGAANQPWRDLMAGNLAGMGGTNLTWYTTDQQANGGSPLSLPGYTENRGAAASQLMSNPVVGGGLDDRLKSLVLAVSQEEGIDPALVLAIMKKENNFTRTPGSAGEIGLMQVKPGNEPGFSKEELSTDLGNIRGGVRRFKQYLNNSAGGDIRVGLAMYNQGPAGYRSGGAKQALGDKYSRDVLQQYAEYRQQEGLKYDPETLPTEVLTNKAETENAAMISAHGWAGIATLLTDTAASLDRLAKGLHEMLAGSGTPKGQVPSNSPGTRGR